MTESAPSGPRRLAATSGKRSSIRRTTRALAPGGTGWTATSIPPASCATSRGCTTSACAACSSSTAGWACRSSSPSRCGRARAAWQRGDRAPPCAPPPSSGSSSPSPHRRDGAPPAAPWVEPDDAMKKVVWSETVVEGGGERDVELAAAPGGRRPLPGLPALGLRATARSGRRIGGSSPSRPARARRRCVPTASSASAPVGDWSRAHRRRRSMPSIALPRDPDGWSSAWIEQGFADPVTVRSVTVGLPGPRGFGAAPPPHAVLQASDDGVVVPRCRRSSRRRRCRSAPRPSRAVTGRRFRLVLSGASAAEALPPVADGVRLAARAASRRTRSSSRSSRCAPAARVHQAEVKAGFGVVPDYYAVDTSRRRMPRRRSIRRGRPRPHRSSCTSGRLRWDAPPGRWRVLRFGASLTGQTNGPALPDSTGLEVDKLDGRRVAAYLERHLARVRSRVAASAPCSATASRRARRTGPTTIVERFRELRGLRPDAVAARARGLRRRRRRGIRSLPLRLSAHARRAARRRSTTARSRPRRTDVA